MRAVLTAMLMTCVSAVAMAETFSLHMPVACSLGHDCHIQNYVDRDPERGEVSDFACGPLSYDGHKGTDIAIPSTTAMMRGVPVIAAAGGTVLGVRDGMQDISMRDVAPEEIDGRDCGNGVLLEHADGWQTQYCHLRKGSVAVARGQRVNAGDVLGLVGLSGRTEFPHLHLSVRHKGKVIDPFEPGGDPACGAAGEALWSEDIAYLAGGILRAGFATEIPAYGDIKARDIHVNEVEPLDPALVFWVYAFGGRKGDRLRIRIEGPTGLFHETEVVIERNQAQFFRATGRKSPRGGLPSGTYSGRVDLVRNDKIMTSRERVTTVR